MPKSPRAAKMGLSKFECLKFLFKSCTRDKNDTPTIKEALDIEGVDTFSGWEESIDGMQKVSKEMFVIPLIKAVQELTQQVEELKLELKTLKGQ